MLFDPRRVRVRSTIGRDGAWTYTVERHEGGSRWLRLSGPWNTVQEAADARDRIIGHTPELSALAKM